MGKGNSKLFDWINMAGFVWLAIIMLLPFLNVITLSLEPAHIAAETGVLHLFPREITFEAYISIWQYGSIQSAFMNSAFITVTGTLLAVLATGMLAYGLSHREITGMRLITYLALLTMVFKTGIMPTYMLVKHLGLIDSLWAVIIPQMLTAFNLILMKVFFEQLPKELSESARMDGCTEMGTFFRIIIPISAPIIATISLFYAVEYWNEYFTAVMFLTSVDKKPLQVLLREILIESVNEGSGADSLNLGKNMKMATAVYAIVPILFVYPFLQKHFTKGILLGAVKG